MVRTLLFTSKDKYHRLSIYTMPVQLSNDSDGIRVTASSEEQEDANEAKPDTGWHVNDSAVCSIAVLPFSSWQKTVYAHINIIIQQINEPSTSCYWFLLLR